MLKLSMAKDALITPKIVEEFERPGPRYTSYPTIPFWDQSPSQESIKQAIREEFLKGSNFSLYFHLPFCEKLCHFCACFKVIDPRREHSAPYLQHLFKEVELASSDLGGPLKVSQMHWGGGTPTYYSAQDLESLFRGIDQYVEWQKEAEISLEANPVVTTNEQLERMRKLGFNRISFGVQDFDPKVQDVINRHQTYEQTAKLCQQARELGYKSVNVDLVYGLPLQTKDTIRSTIRSIIDLQPDRIAFYSYANVPWKHPFQRRFKDEDLPTGMSKIELYLLGRELLIDAGYFTVGMDHFALAHDELLQARDQNKLHRNFMGYTTQADAQLLGFGISAISMLNNLYWQNIKTLPEYYRRLTDSRLPVERGLQLNQDDKIRRYVIMQLMCNFALDFSELKKQFQIDFHSYFQTLIHELKMLETKDLLKLENNSLIVLPRGQLLIRNIALLFDAYLKNKEDYQLFSRTI